jgi:hypothetical protein
MPPVECTSLAGAEATQYLALSPIYEDYYPFMEYNQPLYRQEILLSSAALPDTPNPLVSTCNFFVYYFFFNCLGFNFFSINISMIKNLQRAKKNETKLYSRQSA